MLKDKEQDRLPEESIIRSKDGDWFVKYNNAWYPFEEMDFTTVHPVPKPTAFVCYTHIEKAHSIIRYSGQ